MAAVRNGVGRETAHEAIKEAAVGTALDMRHGQTDNDVFARLAADPRLGLSAAQLDVARRRADHVHRRRRRPDPGRLPPGGRGRRTPPGGGGVLARRDPLVRFSGSTHRGAPSRHGAAAGHDGRPAGAADRHGRRDRRAAEGLPQRGADRVQPHVHGTRHPARRGRHLLRRRATRARSSAAVAGAVEPRSTAATRPPAGTRTCSTPPRTRRGSGRCTPPALRPAGSRLDDPRGLRGSSRRRGLHPDVADGHPVGASALHEVRLR